MTMTIAEARTRYRYEMRRRAKHEGVSHKDAISVGIPYLNAIAASGLTIRHISWYNDEPTVHLDDGILVQDLRTGAVNLHARCSWYSCFDGQHHRAHPADTPEDAVRLLQGPIARLAEVGRMLREEGDQSGEDVRTLYRAALDQVTRDETELFDENRLETGMELIDLLEAKGIGIDRVQTSRGGATLHLASGAIVQTGRNEFQILYDVEGMAVRRVVEGTYPSTPEDAVRTYLEVGIPLGVAETAERQRRQAVKTEARNVERKRQEDVIARYEALSPEEKAAAMVVIDYCEVALARLPLPLRIMLTPRRLLGHVEEHGMPSQDDGCHATLKQMARDAMLPV